MTVHRRQLAQFRLDADSSMCFVEPVSQFEGGVSRRGRRQ